MKTRIFFRALQRGWWVILMTALVALATSMLVSYLTEPVYKVSAKFIVIASAYPTSENNELNPSSIQSRVVAATTFAEIMNSQNIKTKTLQSLDLQSGNAEKYNYQASVVPNSSIIQLTASGPNSQIVALLANTVGDQTIIYFSQTNQGGEVSFLDKAIPATTPTSPQPLRDAAIALELGIITGAILVFIIEQLRVPLEAYRMRLHFDGNTGVYSLGYFSRLVEETLAGNSDKILTIGIIELQGLHDLHDTIPLQDFHRLLRLAIDSIRRDLRGDDVIARWDNVAFIVMMQDTHVESAVRVFDRIRIRLLRPVEINRMDVSIQFNPYIGVCEYSGNLTVQEIFENAYAALNHAHQGSGLSIWKKDDSLIVKKDME